MQPTDFRRITSAWCIISLKPLVQRTSPEMAYCELTRWFFTHFKSVVQWSFVNWSARGTGSVIDLHIRDSSYLEGGGLVQTWGGLLFFMQAQKGGWNNLVHVIKGWPLFFMQSCWGQGVNLEFLCSHSRSSVNIIWNTSLLGPMSRSSPDLNKQYIVKTECKICLFND